MPKQKYSSYHFEAKTLSYIAFNVSIFQLDTDIFVGKINENQLNFISSDNYGKNISQKVCGSLFDY